MKLWVLPCSFTIRAGLQKKVRAVQGRIFVMPAQWRTFWAFRITLLMRSAALRIAS